MSLISICQRVCDAVGLPRPSTVSASTDPLPRQLMALANEVLEDLCRKDWPSLVTTYDFSTVAGQDTYDLPADWLRQVADTVYISTQYYGLRGSLSPAEWQGRRNALPSQLGRYTYRIFGYPLKFKIYPTPDVVEDLSLEYVTSSRTIKLDDGSLRAEYIEDTDVSIIPEEIVRKGLKWKIKHAKGLDYTEDFNDFEMSLGTIFAQQLVLGSVPVAYLRTTDTPELYDGYVPENGFGS